MLTNYSVSTKILKPLGEVFQAVVEKQHIIRYFADESSDNLIPGQQVIWHWQQWGNYPVIVKEVLNNQRITLSLDAKAWQKTQGESYDVTVIIAFETVSDDETLVTISEQGWPQDSQGLTASHENCGGWMHMLMCLKAYIEHDIDLR
ncbi:ATPase [Thalassotalea insulae]|uniref:ATPase n=1 Tax=Thalassotalea insulae TaxID=2056778 RepID=A0ABQ6GTH9_9GAMM|nr:SRPBCC domain-containing protein [Thalassotalea insulae]GLX77986.1 ATPase [Thalassotalea insulae]